MNPEHVLLILEVARFAVALACIFMWVKRTAPLHDVRRFGWRSITAGAVFFGLAELIEMQEQYTNSRPYEIELTKDIVYLVAAVLVFFGVRRWTAMLEAMQAERTRANKLSEALDESERAVRRVSARRDELSARLEKMACRYPTTNGKAAGS